MTAKTKHVYPDHTLEKRLIEQGCVVRCMWQIKGPKDTLVEWMEYLLVTPPDSHPRGVIVQTFKEDSGWTAFREASVLLNIDENVKAVME